MYWFRISGIGHNKCMDATYAIIRFTVYDKTVIETGLTLEEAQEHCRREDTSGDGWFDGYTEE